MTHLRIEQNNIQENVSSAVIKKLYELATSGDLDQSSNLAGVVSIPGGYAIWKNTLETMFPDFHLTMGREYVPFNDPAFEAACVANFSSDGIGMTMTDFQAVTDNRPLYAFNGNGSIVDMSEFKYFTNMPGDPNDNDQTYTGIPLSYISNLRIIEFPDQIQRLVIHHGYISQEDRYAFLRTFYKTENIQSVHISNNIKTLYLDNGWAIMDLRYCTSLELFSVTGSQATEIYLPRSIKRIGSRQFYECPNLKKVVVQDGGTQSFIITNDMGYDMMFAPDASGVTLDLPSNTTQVHRQMFNGNKVSTFILRAVTPPTAIDEDDNTTTTGMSFAGSIDLYVPDESINTYQSNSIYSGFNHIYGLSQLPLNYSPEPASSNT